MAPSGAPLASNVTYMNYLVRGIALGTCSALQSEGLDSYSEAYRVKDNCFLTLIFRELEFMHNTKLEPGE